jgi:hypothetical protein
MARRPDRQLTESEGVGGPVGERPVPGEIQQGTGPVS